MTSSKPTKKTGSSNMKQSQLRFTPHKSSASSKLGKGKRSATPTSSIASESVSEADGVSSDEDVPQTPVVEEPKVTVVVGEELRLNDKRWAKPFQWARSKNEHLKPIHDKGQDKFDYILRVFDNSHEYGPCVGIPRLQRWERAQAMGLNPPPEIRDILLTRQGQAQDRLSQSCFHGEV
ncbi:hypothetical protein AURDEDRAFT_113033 [Auricularia subglabra TFB-10046 SS5]|nr:hypothetical protein AURDEDRAFT_113033 [Auricularia subglabra TFB-10046 SS5]